MEVVLQIENSSDTFFRTLVEDELKRIAFDTEMSLDERREALWESSKEFAVTRLSMVDYELILDGSGDEATWEEIRDGFQNS